MFQLLGDILYLFLHSLFLPQTTVNVPEASNECSVLGTGEYTVTQLSRKYASGRYLKNNFTEHGIRCNLFFHRLLMQ